MPEIDPQKYYEAESQRKVLFIMNLSNMLNALNLQTLKLPHEILQEGRNDTVGTTYADIEKSIINGVKIIYAQLKPTRDEYGADYVDAEGNSLEKPKDFDEAMDMLGWIYSLLSKADMLNDRVVEVRLPDDDDDEDEVEEIATND